MTCRVLYERWRRFQDNNSDDEEGDQTANVLLSASGEAMSTKVTPRSSPPGEDAGLQKVTINFICILIILWPVGSVGRAFTLQSKGCRFDSGLLQLDV